MDEALLLLAVHLAIRAEKVADQRAAKSLAQQLAAPFPRPALIDVIERVRRAGEGPEIAVLAIGPPSGFVDVDMLGAAQRHLELLIVPVEPVADALHLPGDRTGTDRKLRQI